jgi:hypothetical protein
LKSPLAGQRAFFMAGFMARLGWVKIKKIAITATRARKAIWL